MLGRFIYLIVGAIVAWFVNEFEGPLEPWTHVVTALFWPIALVIYAWEGLKIHYP